MNQISRLNKLPLRKLWPHEALNFTKWLSENLDFLSKMLGFELTLVESEASAGQFSADILAEDPRGHFVIIENQLEKTDHDHMGKLFTYMSNLEAKTAIWISSEPRPEHEIAIQWLNEILPADTAFYLLKIEAKFGAPLDWLRLSEQKTSRIEKTLTDSGLSDIEQWLELQEKMIDAMIRLEEAMKSTAEFSS